MISSTMYAYWCKLLHSIICVPPFDADPGSDLGL